MSSQSVQDGPPSWHRLLAAVQLGRAVHLVWESSASWTIASAVLLLVQGILPLASLYLMKLIVDSVVPGPSQADFRYVVILISLAGLVALMIALSRTASTIANEYQSALVSDHVQDILHAKSVEVDLEYYENSRYYDALHRAQGEAPYRPTRIVDGLAQLGQNGISLVGVVALLVTLNWVMAVAVLAASIPGVFVRVRYANKLYHWQRSATERERQAWYFHEVLTGDSHAKEVRLFDLGHLFMERYRDLRHRLRREKLEINTRRSTADIAAQAVAVLAIFGSFAFIAYQTFLGSITVGSLVMYFGAIQQGQSFMQNLLSSLAGLYEDNLFLSNLYEFLDLVPKVRETSNPKPVPQPIKDGISFEHVNFHYPGSAAAVLEDISLHIAPGQTVALVGENGSGKTTLIKLLCRLYDPTVGRISIDGIDLRDFRTSDLRREMSVVFQDYARYNLTAMENIWLGRSDCPPDMSNIIEAAELSGADCFIDDLERGYETVLGRWFENGAELSIGEWQKVALARAFLRDAQVVILDEPTSALDAKAEEEVFRKFQQLAEGRTAIIISHRLSTVRAADRIFYLKDGKILESGTHEELIDLNGGYAQLFEAQAKHYR